MKQGHATWQKFTNPSSAGHGELLHDIAERHLLAPDRGSRLGVYFFYVGGENVRLVIAAAGSQQYVVGMPIQGDNCRSAHKRVNCEAPASWQGARSKASHRVPAGEKSAKCHSSRIEITKHCTRKSQFV